jgi:RNA 2',3'-cyclic 3'-phosphodiesterase
VTQTIRTFVAVEMDPAIRKAAQRLIEKFRATGAGVSWGAAENMHLTLKFLGDVGVGDIPRVCQAVREAAAGAAPFGLQVRGAGAFPNLTRPRVIWLGASEGQEAMAALAERIESALEELGFPREGRRFQSHLTLGRVRRGGPGMAALAQLVQEHAAVEIGQSPIDEVVVFSSQLKPTGSVYDALDRAPLGGA